MSASNSVKSALGQLIFGITLLVFGVLFVLFSEWLYRGSDPARQRTEKVSNGLYMHVVPLTDARRAELDVSRRNNRVFFDLAGGVVIAAGFWVVRESRQTERQQETSASGASR